MEIINIQAVVTALAISLVVQYLVDKLKYTLPSIKNDAFYSFLIAAVAFLLSLILVLAFNIEMFTSNYIFINYVLTALFVSGGSSAINELLGALQNIKNNGGKE